MKKSVGKVVRAKANVITTPESTVDDFESVAKRLECDEDKERFESALGKIAKPAPKVEAKGKKPSKKRST